MLENSCTNGINTIWIGTSSSPTTIRKSESRKGKSTHAKPYAASAQKKTGRTVAGTVMITLLMNEFSMPCEPSTC